MSKSGVQTLRTYNYHSQCRAVDHSWQQRPLREGHVELRMRNILWLQEEEVSLDPLSLVT